MTKSTDHTQRKPKNIPLIILGVLFLIIVILAALHYIGRAVQANVTDGTENYSGIQLEIAHRAIENHKMIDAISPVSSGNTYRVEAIRPMSDKGKADCPEYLPYSDNPDEIAHYEAEVSHITYFGIKANTRTLYGCGNQLNP